MNLSALVSHERAPAIDATAVRKDPAGAVKALIADRRAWFERCIRERVDALDVNRMSTEVIDEAVRALVMSAVVPEARDGSPLPAEQMNAFAVIALGGYGRSEMGPSSDIDLLFLVEPERGDAAQTVVDSVLYPFWDSGVEIGGATRTIADCRSMMEHDVKALTAMIDARFICGNPRLFEAFIRTRTEFFAQARFPKRFVLAKIEERSTRLARFGDSLYLLQPDLKEGEGGLRDWHTLCWVAFALAPERSSQEAVRALILESEWKALMRSLRFLWSVRHALNLVSVSGGDRLLETVQEEVAQQLGYQSLEGSNAAERLMSDYYRHAEQVRALTERGIELIRRKLFPASKSQRLLARMRMGNGIRLTPFGTIEIAGKGSPSIAEIGKLFLKSAQSGKPIDPLMLPRVSETILKIDVISNRLQPLSHAMVRLFSELRFLDIALRSMRDCTVLFRLFPEMEQAFYHVQHDGFHYYTAGVHSLRAVAEVSLLARGTVGDEVPTRALSMVRRRHVLALATWLHDVGKGRGGDHALIGASLARAIAERLGFQPEDAADVEFLVRSHLLMSVLAFRRDVSDPALVERFAESFRSPELLAMLYLLTWADVRAIGPHIWSDWKAGLLASLFDRTWEVLTQKGERGSARLLREETKLVREVARKVGTTDAIAEIRAFLSEMPARYRYGVSAEAIAAHYLMAQEIDRQPLAVLTRPSITPGCTEFSVVTRDAPGLFAKIAGVLSAGGANIVDAQLATSSRGIAIDVLLMTDALHQPFSDPEALARIRAELAEVISGKRSLVEIVGGRFKRRLLEQAARRRASEVLVDNDVSASHTVVEVHADDRRGLLYSIASTFHELHCSIDLARITTSVDRVIDVFYIQDEQGKKIESRERLQSIRHKLLEALEE